nr:MAG TPA: hypothetical protein [Caudoviricetes sp.]
MIIKILHTLLLFAIKRANFVQIKEIHTYD